MIVCVENRGRDVLVHIDDGDPDFEPFVGLNCYGVIEQFTISELRELADAMEAEQSRRIIEDEQA